MTPLSPREVRVLAAIARAEGDRDVAARRLRLAPKTVDHYLDSARRKLGVSTTWRAVGEARRRGYFKRSRPVPEGQLSWEDAA